MRLKISYRGGVVLIHLSGYKNSIRNRKGEQGSSQLELSDQPGINKRAGCKVEKEIIDRICSAAEELKKFLNCIYQID